MAKSRTALMLLLTVSPAPTAAQILPVRADPLGDIERARLDQALNGGVPLSRACDPGEGDEIVICGDGPLRDLRVPYEPVPGSRPVRAMGELPRPEDPDKCLRLCHQPVGVSVDPIRLIRDPVGALRDMLRGNRR
jgi:hypothetical protein